MASRRQLNALFALNRLKADLLKDSLSQLWNYPQERRRVALLAELDRPVALAATAIEEETGPQVDRLEGISNYCRTKVPMGVIGAVNGNIKALLSRGRGCRNLHYLLLKAQRLAAPRPNSSFFRKPSSMRIYPDFLSRADL